ncbi:hypothetical protein K7432_000485 [Basidiobolus ranarum]|uniref:Uncharacterized protein n=1 Tax=Basidiobolus ranarum TaxID=34480 RepID=A0ABR2WB69_9FUNG
MLFPTLTVAILFSIQLTNSLPVSVYPEGPNVQTRYARINCVRPGIYCLGQATQAAPVYDETGAAPLLKQKFLTITRNHNNLNTAQAHKKKAARVKYQDGPSVELEGEQTGYKKYEHKGGSVPI